MNPPKSNSELPLPHNIDGKPFFGYVEFIRTGIILRENGGMGVVGLVRSDDAAKTTVDNWAELLSDVTSQVGIILAQHKKYGDTLGDKDEVSPEEVMQVVDDLLQKVRSEVTQTLNRDNFLSYKMLSSQVGDKQRVTKIDTLSGPTPTEPEGDTGGLF